MVLLCENQEGYRNLIKWSRQGTWRGSTTSRASIWTCWRRTRKAHRLSACLRGHIPETLLADKYDDARRVAHTYADVFGRTIFSWRSRTILDQDRRLHAGAEPAFARDRAAAGGYQRLALPAPGDARARDSAVHPDRQGMSDPSRMRWGPPSLFEVAAGNDELFGELEDAVDRTGRSRNGATSPWKR